MEYASRQEKPKATSKAVVSGKNNPDMLPPKPDVPVVDSPWEFNVIPSVIYPASDFSDYNVLADIKEKAFKSVYKIHSYYSTITKPKFAITIENLKNGIITGFPTREEFEQYKEEWKNRYKAQTGDGYKIRINSGDTFSGIAKRYNITIGELKRVNPQIEDINKIKVGEYINIPIVKRSKTSVYKDNQRNNQLNQKVLDLQKFEQYPDYGSSTGWSLRNINHTEEFEETNANSGYEVGLASMNNYDVVNFTGGLLEAIKVDTAMVNFENEIVNRIKSDLRFGEKEFYDYGVKVVGFGGTRWSSPEETWSSASRENPLLHKSTWMVAANQLTWLLRNATVKYFAEVNKKGVITIQYRLHDQLDLSPQKGRQQAYNNISKVLGFGYHSLGGGNKNMQTRATWKSIR